MRLVSACMDGRRETVRKLLAAGVDPDGPEQLRGQPLSFAILNGHVEVVHALLDAGADPEALSVDGSTPLYTAKQCNPEIYRLLRARGARRTGAAVRARSRR
jgi:cytohesin